MNRWTMNDEEKIEGKRIQIELYYKRITWGKRCVSVNQKQH